MKAARQAVARAAELQRDPERVRNIAIVAHVDAGKTTITDALLAEAGLLLGSRAGTSKAMMQRDDEVERGVTIKANSVTLPLEAELPPLRGPHHNPNWPGPAPPAPPAGGPEAEAEAKAREPRRETVVVNFTDTPGHVDFSSEVSAALRVTDGAVVVIDAVEGVCVQTKTVLRQALAERVRPVLFVNKLDRLFCELDEDEESAYLRLRGHVEDVNALIGAQAEGPLGDATVWPQTGTVAFGSGLYGWGFSLDLFAGLYCGRFGLSRAKMRKRLWGDWFWDGRRRQWVRERARPSQVRGFCLLVVRPLRQLLAQAHAPEPDRARLAAMLASAAGLEPAAAAAAVRDPAAGGALARATMGAWMPLGRLLASTIARHLPSPAAAQRYRADRLYAGPQDDACAEAVRRCDPAGPLVVYVSKMVPAAAGQRFLAYGRVFSGTVRAGQTVRVQGPSFKPGEARSAPRVRLAGVSQLMVSQALPRDGVPAGSTVVLAGLDAHVVRAATLVGADDEALAGAHSFAGVRHAVAPVVRVAVEPRRAADLPRLVQGLARLERGDSLVQVTQAPTGEYIVAGAGELHLEVCLRDLSQLYMGGAEVRAAEPVVTFAETVTRGGDSVLARSPNRLNRLQAAAAPLDGALVDALNEAQDLAGARDALRDECDWSAAEQRRVWAFGLPPDGRANLLVDRTRGVPYLHDARQAFAASFGQWTLAGALADEPVRGVCLSIEDAVLHGDSRHRSDGQVIPMVRCAAQAAQLAAGPALVEPVFLVEVTVPVDRVQAVYGEMRRRRAEVVVDEHAPSYGAGAGGDTIVRVHLPVRHSFGLDGELRGATSGHAFMQASFSHWAPVPGDPSREGSECHEIVAAVRRRKGMCATPPGVSQFGDLVRSHG